MAAQYEHDPDLPSFGRRLPTLDSLSLSSSRKSSVSATTSLPLSPSNFSQPEHSSRTTRARTKATNHLQPPHHQPSLSTPIVSNSSLDAPPSLNDASGARPYHHQGLHTPPTTATTSTNTLSQTTHVTGDLHGRPNTTSAARSTAHSPHSSANVRAAAWQSAVKAEEDDAPLPTGPPHPHRYHQQQLDLSSPVGQHANHPHYHQQGSPYQWQAGFPVHGPTTSTVYLPAPQQYDSPLQSSGAGRHSHDMQYPSPVSSMSPNSPTDVAFRSVELYGQMSQPSQYQHFGFASSSRSPWLMTQHAPPFDEDYPSQQTQWHQRGEAAGPPEGDSMIPPQWRGHQYSPQAQHRVQDYSPATPQYHTMHNLGHQSIGNVPPSPAGYPPPHHPQTPTHRWPNPQLPYPLHIVPQSPSGHPQNDGPQSWASPIESALPSPGLDQPASPTSLKSSRSERVSGVVKGKTRKTWSNSEYNMLCDLAEESKRGDPTADIDWDYVTNGFGGRRCRQGIMTVAAKRGLKISTREARTSATKRRKSPPHKDTT